MMSDRPIRALVAQDAGLASQRVAAHLPQDSGFTVLDHVTGLFPPSDAMQSSDADLLVIVSSGESDDALALVEWWSHHHSGRPVVVFCEGSPNGFVQKAFAAGVDDLLVLEPGPEISPASQEQIRFALRKAVARRTAPAEVASGLGRLICTLGPKGGIGKTLTSSNLAVALAEAGKRVVLVDLDLQFGDLALALGLSPDLTIYDLVTAGGSLDAEKLEAYLTPHSSGLLLLLAPVRPDQAGAVTIEFLRDVYTLLRERFDYVVVDTPPGFTPEVITSIDASTDICMIGCLDALSLKNTKLGLETLELMGYDQTRVKILLNRADSSVGITHSDVLTIIGRAPDVLVPSTRDVTRSVNEGTPIVQAQRRSEAAKSFRALAELYTAAEPENGKRAKRSLLGRSRG
jgi:pilus assembly protein CpaE